MLEIAAGTGNLTVTLLAHAGVGHVTALDSAAETLAIARTKSRGTAE